MGDGAPLSDHGCRPGEVGLLPGSGANVSGRDLIPATLMFIGDRGNQLRREVGHSTAGLRVPTAYGHTVGWASEELMFL
jgi:hypothetical protein